VDLLEGFSGQGSASLTSPEQLASPCFLMTLCCLVAHADLAACRHMPAFWGAVEDRHICFAWVVWTGALAPLVKGSSETDC
jgi:hypothetical protein